MKSQKTTISEVSLIYGSKVKASDRPQVKCSNVNTCDECWEMLNHSYTDDLSAMISDADPGL